MTNAAAKAHDLIDRAGSAFNARDAAAYIIAATFAEGGQPNADTVQAFRLLDRVVAIQTGVFR